MEVSSPQPRHPSAPDAMNIDKGKEMTQRAMGHPLWLKQTAFHPSVSPRMTPLPHQYISLTPPRVIKSFIGVAPIC